MTILNFRSWIDEHDGDDKYEHKKWAFSAYYSCCMSKWNMIIYFIRQLVIYLQKKIKRHTDFFFFYGLHARKTNKNLFVIFLYNMVVCTIFAAKTWFIGKKFCLLQNISLAQLYFLLFVILLY